MIILILLMKIVQAYVVWFKELCRLMRELASSTDNPLRSD